MANSYIVFEFEDVERLNDENIHFNIRNLDSLQNAYFNETYKDAGRTTGKVLPTTPNDIPLQNLTLGERYALDFFNFVKIDYSGLDLFDVIINSNTVTITAKEHNWDFLQVTGLNGVNATLSPTDYSPSTYEIVDSSIIESDVNKCGNFKISIQTTELTTDVVLNGIPVIANNTENPFSLEINRDIPFIIKMYNISSARLVYGSGNGIPSFSLENNDLIINQSLHGATIIVNPKSHKGESILNLINLEYSIDNINWQDSNIFSGQANGVGEVYVRDSLGCKKSISYEVKGISTRDPFVFISKANPINFRKLEEIDDINIFKNNDNSFDSLNNLNYCFPSLFKTKDITRIQFKSNFEAINVFLRNESNDLNEINLEKKTQNLNLFEKMDCIIYRYKVGELGIYFENGKTYSKEGVENGEYILSGNLPDLAVIGNLISIDDIGILEIKDVLFDSNINKKIIVVEYNFNELPLTTIIESLYDILPYEVYEFEIDWEDYGEGLYDLYVQNLNIQTNGEEEISSQIITLQSDNILISEEQENTLAIHYWNENNKDIFYKYGIKHFLRASYSYIEAGTKEESEINEGDLSTELIRSSVYETDTFTFIDLDDEKMRKMVIALSCENVFINGIGYVKNGSVNKEPIENTNLHNLSVEMIKTNINYNNNTQGQEGIDSNYLPFNIPPFLNADGSFMKI